MTGLLCVTLLAGALPASAAAAEAPAPPANDNLSSAQVIHSLPATISGTVVGSTAEAHEELSTCAPASEHTVWYAFRAGAAERIALNLAAGGALDATIDVFHAVRSQLEAVGCERTDSHGNAALSFKASKNGLYEIRVSALPASQLAGFTLEVFLPTPAVSPPGPRLPAGGVSGQVDRIQNVNAAYSVVMRSGVSYLVSVANKTSHACVSAGLFAPGTGSFEEASPVMHLHCGGYALYTPGPGQGGLYSIQLTPRSSFRGVQRFRLEVAPAGPDETAPGIPLGNYELARGRLDGNGVHVLRLYRLDITTHSNLTLRLGAPESANFDLQLRNLDGNVIECQCGGSGPETLTHQLLPGRYYAVVSARGPTVGSYTLLRQSRTITQTRVSFGGSNVAAGEPVGIRVSVSPAVSGPVVVDIERFDPVFGWQFYRQESGIASGGEAVLPFAPEAIGRWRANARFEGSRTASPSAVGFTYLLAS
ncbi:MAG: hypothetical protein ACLQBB_05015 [Solirubrobacteraceae bacterium]